MENTVPDLAEFFRTESGSSEIPPTAAYAADQLARLRAQLADKVPAVFWSAANDAVADALRKILDTPLTEILGAGWNAYRSLLKYRDPKKYPPDEVILFPLKEHKITSSHKPQIEILVNDQVVDTIEFEIKLGLEIEMATLRIQAGKIKEVEAGAVTGTGTLMCGSAILLDCKSKKIQLPTVLSFGEGLPIGPRVE
jgi:hypothetical protein